MKGGSRWAPLSPVVPTLERCRGSAVAASMRTHPSLPRWAVSSVRLFSTTAAGDSTSAAVSACSSSSTSALGPSPRLSSSPSSERKNLFGLSRSDFGDLVARELGPMGWQPDLHTKILWGWIHRYGKNSFMHIPGIRRELREQLAARYVVDQGHVPTHHLSEDGTRKFLIKFSSGQEVESVFIPETTRGTLCVSSQVGCSLSCSFCHTGTQPVMRNLTAGEIVSQVMQAKRVLNDFPTVEDLETRRRYIMEKRKLKRQQFAEYFHSKRPQHAHSTPPRPQAELPTAPEELQRTITNIVFMGQGEPFYNYKNVKQAIQLLSHGEGLGIGQPKITVSTSGVVPNIYRLAEDTKVNLAISLHAPYDELRYLEAELIERLMDACRSFISNRKKRIMFEYVMLKDVNDREQDAHKLAQLLAGFPYSLINLIPFNPWPGTKYECSSKDQILAFHKVLVDHNLPTTIRWPRGNDIMAACGQLKTHHDRVRRMENTM